MHTQTRQDSSGKVISPSQKPLPGSTEHSQEKKKTYMPLAGIFICKTVSLLAITHYRAGWLVFLTVVFVRYSTYCHLQPWWVLEEMGGVCCPRMYGAILSPFSPALIESGADGEGVGVGVGFEPAIPKASGRGHTSWTARPPGSPHLLVLT